MTLPLEIRSILTLMRSTGQPMCVWWDKQVFANAAYWDLQLELDEEQKKMILQVQRTGQEAILADRHGRLRFSPLPLTTSGHPGTILFVDSIASVVQNIEEMKKSIRMRDDFLSIASHELRTPITAIKLHAQMLRRNMNEAIEHRTLPAKVDRLIENTDRAINRMNRLIEDMLDLSRINNGKLRLQKENVRITNVLKQSLAQFEQELEDHEITLLVEVDGDPFVYADACRLEQVFSNIVTNVIRYAPGAPLHVCLQKDHRFATIRFKDHGPGIDEDDQQKVFQRFERLMADRDRSGFGLGLFICKEIIEAHDGTIRIESHRGDGATFIISVPLS